MCLYGNRYNGEMYKVFKGYSEDKQCQIYGAVAVENIFSKKVLTYIKKCDILS